MNFRGILFSNLILVAVLGLLVGCSTLSNSTKAGLRIPASETYGTSTGFHVQKGQKVEISAQGKWCWALGVECSANGTLGRPNADEHPVALEGYPFGLLLGRIGDWVFPIGTKKTITAQQSGEILLFMNDRVLFYGDNSGFVEVSLKLK